ncbi:DNA-binding, integrase-type protein, partial [Tanacetum coccineum]
MATTATTPIPPPPPPHPPHPTVNLHKLTQSDLYTLSLTTNPSPQPPNTVTPKINRSLFNESTGSRKQTYSHLRLPSSTSLHRRKFHLRMSSLTVTPPEQAENTHIIQILKNLCKQDVNLTELGQDEEKNSEFEKLSYESLGIKRKRGRPRKHENVVFIRPPNAKRLRSGSVKKEVVFDGEIDKVIVNEKGEMVDVAKVGEMDEVFGGEIRRRTVGMGSEEELLVFLRELNGQWGSRRRKRRVVDAGEFGDVLPKGWKVSLSIKKKEGRVWLFCRRFI